MSRIVVLFVFALYSFSVKAETSAERNNVKRAVLDYIESQHKAEPGLMKRGLDKKLAKRTY